MQNNKIVYPHRKSLFTQQCDVCNSRGHDFIPVNTRSYIGLWVCNKENCINKAKSWINTATIDKKELQKQFGNWVYVQRSNGTEESEWLIVSNAVKEKHDGPYWLYVSKKHKTKCVTLEKLKSWNN
tara:strand:+ start:909 stop:1286 length:378 start_codon:yes stop_codon:yes gene_type:complete